MCKASRTVGQRIREVRIAKGLTQEQVASKSGFSETFLSRLETGKANPTIETISKLASSLDTHIGVILKFGEDNPERTRAALHKLIDGLSEEALINYQRELILKS